MAKPKNPKLSRPTHLDIVRVPTPTNVKRQNRRVQIGKSGLCISDFWVAIFAANESLPTNAKLTDEAIKRKAIEEFSNLKPHKPGDMTLAKALETGLYRIPRFRWRYNQGRYTNGRKPKPQSRPYN